MVFSSFNLLVTEEGHVSIEPYGDDGSTVPAGIDDGNNMGPRGGDL
jgi:hypothetical protein